jgi:hypothetical protein
MAGCIDHGSSAVRNPTSAHGTLRDMTSERTKASSRSQSGVDALKREVEGQDI